MTAKQVSYSASEPGQQCYDALVSHYCQVLLIATGNRCNGSARTGKHLQVVGLEQIDEQFETTNEAANQLGGVLHSTSSLRSL